MKAKFIFFFLLLSLSFTYAQTIRYVRPVASGSGDGSSWANASSNLQAMINASGVQEVWVAAGTYKPTTGTDRAISFSMKNGVTIYGGFPNDGSGTLANRNPIANETILSGDIGNVGEVNDNSYHVVANGNGINSTAKLDGFVITGGNADKVTLPSEIFGGGIFNDGRNGASCSPSFTNCILRQNSAITGGGVGNSGDSGTCNPTFVNCVFYQNQGYGFCGAFVSQGNVNSVLTNCTFAYNSCMYGGGAIYSARNFGAPNITLKNCILWGNNANTGGNQIRLFSSTLTLSNTTLQSGVNGILNAQSLSTINNNGNILTIDPLFVNASTGDLRLTACSPAINAGDNTGISGVDLANNPRIFNNGVVDMGAYELQSSPITAPTAVSISSTTACQGTSVNLLATCASGTVTWYNTSTGGSSIGTGASFSYTAPVGDNQLFYASCKTTTCETALVATTNVLTVYPTRLYVNASATGGRNNGLTWEDAFTDLNSALLRPTFFCPVEIWVAKGVYKPTNSNIRDAFFLTNKAQLSIYGGFDGTETQLSTRNWKNNPTILSGEIGSPSSITDNSRHLFNLNVNQGGSFKIDGFTLTKTYSENDFGGAIRCSSSSSDGLFTISNCIFTDNYALRGGAVMLSGSPFASSTVLTATITNCLFIKNQAIANPNVILPASGAIYSSAFINGTITNCTFSDNVGLNSGGTIYIEKSDLINSGNIILNYTVKNSIFWNNIPTTEPQLGLNNSQVKISNSILQGGISPTTGTIVNEGNVLDTNPIFVDVANENYSLYACSPAVNLGDNTANSTTTDLAGNQRVFGTKIDMGAYELQSVAVTTPTAVSVSQSAVCQGTSVNLLATCANGTVTWYNTSTGGTSIGTGASLSYTAPVGANQTFYASCKDATCETALGATSNTLTVYAIPSKPTITPPSQLVVCSPSTLTLTANCTTGTVLWSNNATGTSLTL
ncbi:choice-of-anchor Q domain-containing protein, partial [Emticicia sp. W12TSBA100-4]|uniref:choice-of-anchor Q domain-containing protein n=1 Tax=Emticicia sp. W12TSBA100-4 TaxID=3160965 RepID=UPI003305E749